MLRKRKLLPVAACAVATLVLIGAPGSTWAGPGPAPAGAGNGLEQVRAWFAGAWAGLSELWAAQSGVLHSQAKPGAPRGFTQDGTTLGLDAAPVPPGDDPAAGACGPDALPDCPGESTDAGPDFDPHG